MRSIGVDIRAVLLLGLIAIGCGLAPAGVSARAEPMRVGPSAVAIAETMLNDDLSVGNLRRTFPGQFTSNAEFKQVEAIHPGFTDYVVAQIMPKAEQRLLSRLPKQRLRVATYLASKMPERDLAQVVAMLQSPVGRKALDLAQHVNPNPVINELKRSGGQATTSSMQRSANTMLQNNVYGGMTLKEKLEFGRFMATPAGVHWGQAQNGLFQVTAQFVNDYLPSEQAELKSDVLSAAAAYRAEHEGRAQ